MASSPPNLIALLLFLSLSTLRFTASDLSPSSAPSPSPSSTPTPTPESNENFDIALPVDPSIVIDPQLSQICDSTDYPALCLASTAPFLKGKVNVDSVLEVSMETGEKLSESALSKVQKMATDAGASPELSTILKDCEDSYDATLYNYQTALSAFPQRDIGTINTMLSAVITDLADCDDAFKRYGEKFPLSGIAETLANITSNCLATVSLLKL